MQIPFNQLAESSRRAVFFARYEAAMRGHKRVTGYDLARGVRRESRTVMLFNVPEGRAGRAITDMSALLAIHDETFRLPLGTLAHDVLISATQSNRLVSVHDIAQALCNRKARRSTI